MGFEVVKNPLWTTWAPVDYNGGGGAGYTVYQGSIVSCGAATAAGQGVLCMGAAAGASDTTGKVIPFGVVIGTNDSNPTFNSTYKGNSILSVASQANQLARSFQGVEGTFPKSDPMAMVQVAVIGKDTILKGPIFNAAYGTAPSVATVSTGSTDGLGFTASACDFTPVAYNATHFCRSGANKGLMRVGYDTSTTVHTVRVAYPHDIAVGDTFCSVNLNFLGTCRAQFDATSTYVETSAALTSDYYLIDVLELHLEKPGEEYVVFKFNADQFCGARA